MALYLGNTKVKVKSGLARYTVVGSPTITNGIASGFTDDNYLLSDSYMPSPDITKYEFYFKATVTQLDNENGCFLFSYVSGDNKRGGVRLTSDNEIQWVINRISGTTGDKYVTSSITVSQNDTFLIKCGYLDNNTFYMKVSKDNGLNWIEDTTIQDISTFGDINTNRYFSIGGSQIFSTKRPYTCGSIYLNECYIKVNDAYFWRGSKQDILGYKVKYDNLFDGYYIIEDGKLKWANPNIYLQSSGTQYIDTGLKGYYDFKLTAQGTLDNTVSQVIISRHSLQGNWFGQYSSTKMWSIGTDTSSISYLQKGTFDVNFQNKKVTYTYNNTTYEKESTTDYSDNNIYLFCCNSNNKYYATAKLWKCIAYQNNVKIQHLVPVPKGLLIGNFVVPSNGMFDIVEQKFYGNQGTGDFTIGGIPEDYIIDNGKLIWCRNDIYLESTGTQYINTGILTSSDLITDIEYYRESGYLFGYLGTIDNVNKSYGYTSSSSNGYMRIGNWYAYNNTAWSDNKWLKLHVERDNTKANIDGTLFTSFSTGTPTDFNNGQNITLFRYNNAGGSDLVGKIKTFQIYQNSKILQYLVPVPKGMLIGDKISPSNCMFDIVTQTFFENQGTGEFVYGGLGKDLINVGNNIVWTDENVYLQSSGSKYIDTNIKPTNLTKIEGKVLLSEINKCIYGSRTSKTDDDIHDWIVNTATTNFPQFGSDDGSVTFSWTLNQAYVINNSQDGGYVDDTKIKSYSNYTFKSTLNMYLFGLNQNGSLESRSLKGKIYYFEIFENSKLIRYYLPVDTNTAIGSFTVPSPGMWDAVTRKFYPNKGTGSFTYGKDS